MRWRCLATLVTIAGIIARAASGPSAAQGPEGKARPKPSAPHEESGDWVGRLADLARNIGARLDELEDLRERVVDQGFATLRAKAYLVDARERRRSAEGALDDYLANEYPKALDAAKARVARAESGLSHFGRDARFFDEVDKSMPDPTLNGMRKLAARNEIEKAEESMSKERSRLKVLERETNPRRVAELTAVVERTRADESTARDVASSQEKKEARLARRLKTAEWTDVESEALRLLDEALELEEEWTTLSAASKPDRNRDEIQALAAKARAKVDEASTVWTRSRPGRADLETADLKRRLRDEAAGSLRRSKAGPHPPAGAGNKSR